MLIRHLNVTKIIPVPQTRRVYKARLDYIDHETN
jgi:hypothetical protein